MSTLYRTKYIIYLKNNHKFECTSKNVYKTLISLEKRHICSVHKLYHYKTNMNICIYDYDGHYVDYIRTYKNYPLFYGEHVIQNVDIKMLDYLQNKQSNKQNQKCYIT